ncbi:hypothetical protein EXU30_18645 [Shewanella maritima]|uniref:Zinc ribbon domain-containing protein n=1 Tax=Shewanella maritima TaxID=2520507 RepID=A0A411PLM8_9GAMM|nr:hypothetical protein [Shewanella maritima]QBF84456.1 hypothetical protein EXU30_18645 [Shewanella maritima]
MATIIFSWIMFSILVMVVAHRYNRSSIGWFLLSLIISPLFSIIFILVLGKATSTQEIIAAKQHAKQHRDCPECGEEVKAVAKICKHCRAELQPITHQKQESPKITKAAKSTTCIKCGIRETPRLENGEAICSKCTV